MYHHKLYLIVFLFVHVCKFGEGTVEIDIHVPEVAYEGSDVLLVCKYDLGRNRLHSLKWYRENHEFYRVEPKTHPEIFILPNTQGIEVDEWRSNQTHVMLKRVKLGTSGVFTCEITDSEYLTMDKEKYLRVLPSTGSRASKSFGSTLGCLFISLLVTLVTSNCT